MASGDVRFIFRSDETDVNVTIEGKKAWVEGIVEELGLSDVGFLMPIGKKPAALNQLDSAEEGADEEDALLPPTDMGPEPDPSRIPVVRRPIGALNVELEIEKIGLEPPSKNDVFELMDAFSELDEPRPIQGQMSIDPMAEAWLQRLMRVAVRKFGVTALPISVIDSAACEQLDRSGTELELWLEGMWRLGKLVKVDGGGRFGYGPSPRWLEAD